MGKVKFVFSESDTLEVEAYDQLNLLAHAQLEERSLQSRCGGHCECGTCRIIVRRGVLSPMREKEAELLAEVGVVAEQGPEVRLACQCFPEKSCELVEIEVPAERFVDARGRRVNRVKKRS